MKKILPSERISNEICELLSAGTSSHEDLLSVLVRQSFKKMVQEILEQEIRDYLGRDYFERKVEKTNPGHRNGYENRSVKTAEGKIDIEMPQLRNTAKPYRSELFKHIKTRSAELERLVTEMYVRGLSTRDIEETLKDDAGHSFISKSGVSEITASLSEEHSRFCQRDLSGFDVVYLFVDGIYENVRLQLKAKEAIFCAWAILANGRKVLLHLDLGQKESYECWKDFFRNMTARGLRMPLLVVSDGAPGLIRAITECFPKSKRQRCLVHKLRNISNKLPKDVASQVMPEIKNVYYQTNKEVAMLCATSVVEKFAAEYPSAIKCFEEDLECCLNHIDFPMGHHKHIRTTNLIERAFAEQRRRTKVIPGFHSEKSCLKLVYATLIRVSEKWRRVEMSAHDLALLKNIRKIYAPENQQDQFISMKLAA